ncbi:glycoside hydrolase family 16 protein [Athelia psychrophila]|uniref:Glycoside hydrolase family 16 protein n=1 Tax=Athelia psychrophila TaxID=1759441 RepID=A0A166FG55_9AGAM|nr:glycoside hydrolase family 16 protein [Fibularhizoctonia sp. CBS 109695]
MSQPGLYAQAPNSASSATSLLSPSSRGQQTVQATFAQGPKQSLRGTPSSSNLQSPYTFGAGGNASEASISSRSISEKFSLSPDPAAWGTDVRAGQPEDDDALHNPDPRRDRAQDGGGNIFTGRGLSNLGCIFVLVASILTLFAGYPIITYFTKKNLSSLGGYNLGGINGTGQVPSMAGNWGLIDKDTPSSALTSTSYGDGSEWQLVFSDEFNTEGRTFYPGDDPYWEAVDLHYWATNNMEWYGPEAITTANGSLEITLSKMQTHGLDYQGGMMSSWNKFCFTGGQVETAVSLPGAPNIVGLWPAIWTMGNLGRAGYGATLDGTWPYTYDACDVGTVANQTKDNLPLAATTSGPSSVNGQRLSRCTCPGESHPGPIHSDGTYVGRSAPEIDIFEAQISGTPLTGGVSQSAQWAPFNKAYVWDNSSANLIIPNPSISLLNTYIGGEDQQASSVVTTTNQDCYQTRTQCMNVYGIEYKPGFDNAYISWIANGAVAWTINGGGLAADTATEISARPIPQEPLYLLMNLGQSTNFGTVDTKHIPYPVTMRVDYVRVYQAKDSLNVGCDPPEFPTADYINQYIEAYMNPNLTTWKDDYKQPIPKNSFLGEC